MRRRLLFLLLLTCIPQQARADEADVIVELRADELRQRYGSAYDDDCAQVPRFIPRANRYRKLPSAD